MVLLICIRRYKYVRIRSLSVYLYGCSEPGGFSAASTICFHSSLFCTIWIYLFSGILSLLKSKRMLSRQRFLPNNLFPVSLPVMILNAVRFSSMRAICSACLSLRDFIILIISGDAYRVCSSSLCNLRYSSVSLFNLAPNIFLKILFLKTIKLLTSNVIDHVSHP